MTSSTPVSFTDLLTAFDWVSSGAPMESSAFVSRVTGATHLSSTTMDLEEELPEDIEDASLYVEIPHKNDLDLGRNLVPKFVDEKLPDSYSTVVDFFRKPGAYSRFKDLLDRNDMLEAWYEYEAQATEQALREWSDAHGLQLKP